MKFICTCRSKLDDQTAFALDMKRHNFSIELDAESQEQASKSFRMQYIENLDISDASIIISVSPK